MACGVRRKAIRTAEPSPGQLATDGPSWPTDGVWSPSNGVLGRQIFLSSVEASGKRGLEPDEESIVGFVGDRYAPAERIRQRLEHAGARPTVETASFIVSMKPEISPDELERARRWGAALVTDVASTTLAAPAPRIERRVAIRP